MPRARQLRKKCILRNRTKKGLGSKLASSPPHSNAPEKIDIFSAARRFGRAFSRLWILVAVLALVLACITYSWERRSFRPEYRCRAIFSIGFESSYGDAATAQQIASVFPQLAQTDYMRDLIEDRLDTGVINGTITAVTIGNSGMVELSVTSSSAQDAGDILRAVLDAYPQAAAHMAEYSFLQIREEPLVSKDPVSTFSPAASLTKGALAGILLGLAVTAVSALLTATVGNSNDLHRLTGLPVLAILPLVRLTRSPSPEDCLKESLRGLRLRVRKQLEQNGGKTILLTGTIPGEGTSVAAANLALSLAKEGHRVVLLDGDLRNQTVSRLFRGPQTGPGLMELIQDPDLPPEELLKPTPDPNLCYLSGAGTRKRHYSLDGRRLNRILEQLSTQFDYIVVDAPPCGVISDTAVLCRHADAVLYVVKADWASRAQILDALTPLYRDGVPLTGCILNRASRYYHRYGTQTPRQVPPQYPLTKGQRLYLHLKQLADFLIALGAVFLLLIPMLILAAAIKLDDNGPVFFTQRRIGKDQQPFEMLKFRTMHPDTPHNTPTHLLADPRQHITRIGRFLRRTSLDELPQLLNILRGEMSIVGPRPALWSQFDLIDEREVYGVHQVRPGLTGWAQINGRDELDIPEKAALDGEYIRRFGFRMDIKCFLGTFGAVFSGKGMAEGRPDAWNNAENAPHHKP